MAIEPCNPNRDRPTQRAHLVNRSSFGNVSLLHSIIRFACFRKKVGNNGRLFLSKRKMKKMCAKEAVGRKGFEVPDARRSGTSIGLHPKRWIVLLVTDSQDSFVNATLFSPPENTNRQKTTRKRPESQPARVSLFICTWIGLQKQIESFYGSKEKTLFNSADGGGDGVRRVRSLGITGRCFSRPCCIATDDSSHCSIPSDEGSFVGASRAGTEE